MVYQKIANLLDKKSSNQQSKFNTKKLSWNKLMTQKNRIALIVILDLKQQW